jgi:hypothetical protein
MAASRNRERTAKSVSEKETAAPATGRELAITQDRFQRALMEGDLAVLDDILDSSKENRKTLFGVYAHAYRGRLVDVLKSNYEHTAALIGDDEMAALGRDYVTAHPSQNANARYFGDQWPDFLAKRIAGVTGQAVSELAALERALNDVFDAPDAQALVLGDLSALTPGDWPGVQFSALASTRRLNFSTNAAGLWRALNSGEAPPAPATLEAPERLIVFRHEGSGHFREMSYEEAMMWDQMVKGLNFGGLCEMVAMQGGEDGAAGRAAGHLQGWIAAGMLSGPEQD